MIELKQLILAQLVVTATLTGLIWMVQLVHYPGFRFVDHAQFSNFQQHHMRSISYIVVPLMLIEMAFAVWSQLYWWGKDEIYFVIVANILLVVIWLTTFTISGPTHNKLLTNGYNEKLITKLVDTNWIRTIAWTIRTAVLVIISLKV